MHADMPLCLHVLHVIMMQAHKKQTKLPGQSLTNVCYGTVLEYEALHVINL